MTTQGAGRSRKTTRRADDALQIDVQTRDEQDGGHVVMLAQEGGR
jgi:hypothetical protein